MQKNWLKYQKITEILRFENLARLRFCPGLTHKKSYNSLNFEDSQFIFCNVSSLTNLMTSVLTPHPPGGRVKKSKL